MAPVEVSAQAFLVDKFGGTSVATIERIRKIVPLILDEHPDHRRVVVVSALGGVTDLLIDAVDNAIERSDRHGEILSQIIERHNSAIDQLQPAFRADIREVLDELWQELEELLDGVYLLRECTPRTRDAVMSMGERASVRLVAAAFREAGRQAVALDATELVVTDATFGEAGVLLAATNKRIRDRFDEIDPRTIAVVTGFVGSTERGVITTLGRSGSDYTATIFGAALEAERVVIWTDVDGVLSADPRLVPEAFTLPELSYREAGELAFFGTKVLHPRTMRPLKGPGIPLQIRNTLNPSSPGTYISSKSTQEAGHVKAVTTIRNVAVVMVEGSGFLGVPGISARALTALAARGINVPMLSQASSEQSLCAIVNERDADAAVHAISQAFEWELSRGDVSRIYARSGCAIISVVGDHMRERPGLAGKMFATLGRNGVNVLAIAQGASETNISAVVRDSDAQQGVRALHDTFALDHNQAHIFLVGAGIVAQALLEILSEQADNLEKLTGIHLKLVGVANSRKLVWNRDGIAFGDALEKLESDDALPYESILDPLSEGRLERLIVVDATASDAVAGLYSDLMAKRIGIVTPNKRSNTAGQDVDDELLARENDVPYLYETTVGAGLPVIMTLRDLVRSGDQIHRIQGIFSGTLAYLFNNLSEGRRLSEIVAEARALGYTEPDPRDDLNGEDVARKLMILAREMGMRVERSEVEVQSLVPEELQDVSVDDYMDRLSSQDDEWRRRVDEASAEGRRLQYVGTIADGRLSVRVQAVDSSSPFAHLTGTNCMFLFQTERYFDTPLVVQGPGAGPAVTAAGIVGDLVRAVELSR